MNTDIKYIVNALDIHSKKNELLENRKKIFYITCKMSKLTFDRTVGLYAYYLDEIEYLSLSNNLTNLNKIKDLELKISKLPKNKGIDEYKNLKYEYYKLLQNNAYFIAINIDLRNKLSELEIPNIYIKQHECNKNIINGECNYCNDDILISPINEMESNKEFRHFYNKTSFHYLEQLCDDCSFDLNSKDLGKIKIKK